jgi:hypothetical protein
MPDYDNNAPTAAVCKTRNWLFRYRSFLLDPGTLFTLASGLLLILAILLDPGGLFSHDETQKTGSIFYLAAALVGSSYESFEKPDIKYDLKNACQYFRSVQ